MRVYIMVLIIDQRGYIVIGSPHKFVHEKEHPKRHRQLVAREPLAHNSLLDDGHGIAYPKYKSA